MAGSNIGAVVAAIFAVIFLSVVGAPLLMEMNSTNATTPLININATNQQLFITGIAAPLNKTVYSSQGLGASILNNIGFAFVFPAIWSVAVALARIPSVMMTDLNIILTSTGIPQLAGISIAALTGLALAYFGMLFAIKFVSAWQKYDLWNA